MTVLRRYTDAPIAAAPAVYGDGHINDTFRYSVWEGGVEKRYLLQRISRHAFKKPREVMENVRLVIDCMRAAVAARGGDPARETLTLERTLDGDWFYEDADGDVWRVYDFIEGVVSYSFPDSETIFEASGEAFGCFQRTLEGFDASRLHETIARFHDTPNRCRHLLEAAERDACGRLAQARADVAFAREREGFTHQLVDALADGRLPLRVTHNDTKLNNVLIDKETGRGLCVVDLDTVMPGLSAYDFGDAIRFGANTAVEDEPDLSRVALSLPMFAAYARGYLGAARCALTDAEVASLATGARMMTLECGMRFLTDFLNGDTYFKTAYPTHNLVRARDQFALLADMERRAEEMEAIVRQAAEA